MLPNGKVWRSLVWAVSLARFKAPIRSEVGIRARAHIHVKSLHQDRTQSKNAVHNRRDGEGLSRYKILRL